MLDEHLDSRKTLDAGNTGKGAFIQLAPAIEAAPVQERRHSTFFDVINSSLYISTPEQFCAWAKGDLQKIFPHGMMVCGVGLIENNGGRIQKLISCNFPNEYIKTLRQPNGLINSPILAEWIRTRRPVLFEASAQHVKSPWLDNFRRFCLENIVAHGQCDMRSHSTSYFAFSRIPGRLTLRHAELLEMLVPHLHTALTRALNGAKKETSAPKVALPALSEREHEILQWLGSGKTNWEIAQVLQISENTVKNHVHRILIKLKVNNRAQAVAKGLLPG